jgi:biotin synthase
MYTELLTKPLPELIATANAVRHDNLPGVLDLCSIINAKSGTCNQDCKYCAQSSHHNTQVPTYPLKDKDALIGAARQAKDIGAQRFGIVTSGNNLTAEELETICVASQAIICDIGIEVCASLGALRKDALQKLFDAGVKRYHHNIETSERYYKEIVTTHDFKERIDTIRAAKEVGFEVCSGGIIGMGETWEDRVAMAETLRDLDVDAIPLNILVPIAGTPMEHITPIASADVIRTICLFRIINPTKVIKIAAGRETVFNDFQAMGFMAGANGMLIGGYLTIKGRDVVEDHKLIDEIKTLWNV